MEKRLVERSVGKEILVEKKVSKILHYHSNNSGAVGMVVEEKCDHDKTIDFPHPVKNQKILGVSKRGVGSNARNGLNQFDNDHSEEITLTKHSSFKIQTQCSDEFPNLDKIPERLTVEDLAEYATESSSPQGDGGQVGNNPTAQFEATDENVHACSVRNSASQTDSNEGEGMLGKRTDAHPTAATQELPNVTNDTYSLRLDRKFLVMDDFAYSQRREDHDKLIQLLLKTSLENGTAVPEHTVPDDDSKQKYRQLSAFRDPNIVRLVALPIFGPNNFSDLTNEGARLRTFERYEPASLLSALRLANAGFYFTGEEHTLKCYSCGVTFSHTEDNRREDPYQVHRRLSPNCPHVNGQDRRNVFVQDGQRRAQSSLDITGQGAVAVTSSPSPGVQEILHDARQGLHELRNHLAQIGFVVEPLSPQVPQPAVSVLRGDPSVSANSAHMARAATSPPENQLPNGVGHQNSAATLNQEAVPFGSVLHDLSLPPAAPTDITSAAGEVGDRLRNLQEPVPNGDYDPSGAAHPNFGDYRRRLASYGAWPDTHAQSPEGLAWSGFFHTGVGDCVRCHYCGLGLKHWDPDDRPLDEHVRWRSSCGYLRALCGQDVIARILALLGRRQRQRAAGNEENGEDESGGVWNVARNSHSVVASVATNDHGPPAWPQDTPPTPASFLTSSAAESARDMGFSDDLIQQAITALLNTRAGARAVTSQNVVQAILYLRQRSQGAQDEWTTDSDSGDDDVRAPTIAPQAPPPAGGATTHGAGHELSSPEGGPGATPGETEEQRGSPAGYWVAASTAGTSATNGSSQSTEQLERENQELRERRRCKICLDSDVSILFLPCGHLVCCAECAAALLRCPICRVRIRGRVRTQMAPLPPSSANNSNNT